MLVIDPKTTIINWTDIETNWSEYSNKAHSNWNKLTFDQIQILSGKRDDLSALIQSVYLCNRHEAEHQIDLWLNNLLGNSQMHDANISEKLKDNQDTLKKNQDTIETIIERNDIIGSPYHKGY